MRFTTRIIHDIYEVTRGFKVSHYALQQRQRQELINLELENKRAKKLMSLLDRCRTTENLWLLYVCPNAEAPNFAEILRRRCGMTGVSRMRGQGYETFQIFAMGSRLTLISEHTRMMFNGSTPETHYDAAIRRQRGVVA